MAFAWSQSHHLPSSPQQMLSEEFHLHSLKIHSLHGRQRHVPLAPDYSRIGKQTQRALLLLQRTQS